MNRIAALDPALAQGRGADLLSATARQLGRTPNLYRAMAQSPTALEAYLAFRHALGGGALTVQMGERIALLTAARNDCGYCVAAHTFRGGKVGLSPQQLLQTRHARADDAADEAALRFVEALIEHRGRVDDADFAAVKLAGWDDAAIGEMVAHVALNIFSNYFNHVAQPELDFPAVAAAA